MSLPTKSTMWSCEPLTGVTSDSGKTEPHGGGAGSENVGLRAVAWRMGVAGTRLHTWLVEGKSALPLGGGQASCLVISFLECDVQRQRDKARGKVRCNGLSQCGRKAAVDSVASLQITKSTSDFRRPASEPLATMGDSGWKRVSPTQGCGSLEGPTKGPGLNTAHQPEESHP